jgi:hypothetical protein
MAKKTGKKAAKSSASRRKTSRPVASKKKKPSTGIRVAATDAAPANDRFVKDLLVRGDAAHPDSSGKVPRDATHVIESQNEDGTAVVKRVRYKMF